MHRGLSDCVDQSYMSDNKRFIITPIGSSVPTADHFDCRQVEMPKLYEADPLIHNHISKHMNCTLCSLTPVY